MSANIVVLLFGYAAMGAFVAWLDWKNTDVLMQPHPFVFVVAAILWPLWLIATFIMRQHLRH